MEKLKHPSWALRATPLSLGCKLRHEDTGDNQAKAQALLMAADATKACAALIQRERITVSSLRDFISVKSFALCKNPSRKSPGLYCYKEVSVSPTSVGFISEITCYVDILPV